MDGRSSTEDGELVIDMTISDDEDPTSQTMTGNEAVNHSEPNISLEVPEANANVPTAFETSSTPTEALGSETNPLLGSLLQNYPSANSAGPQLKDPNLLSILGNYTPSELARVTTQAMIECIAKFPALWDSQEPSYHNHKYTSLLWKNIAVVLNMNVKKVRNKWSSLRSAYRKEFLKSKATGIPSRFAYFHFLSFLEVETLREKERDDFEKSKLYKALTNLSAIANGLNGTSITNMDDHDDDCMIVESLENCSMNSSTATASESSAIKSNDKSSGNNDEPDRIQSTSQPVNGTSTTDEQARPAFLIRPKNISELMAVPPLLPAPVESAATSTANASNVRARSTSPEIVFLSEASHSVSKEPKIIVSDAFPAPFTSRSNDGESLSTYEACKSNLQDEMWSRMQKYINTPGAPKTTNSTKPKVGAKLAQKGSDKTSKADKTALRFLMEPHGVTSVGDKTGGPSTSNGIPSKKRTTEEPSRKPKMIKKVRLSKESSKGPDQARDTQELIKKNQDFLTSLLPDVEEMTNAQFRTFKKQATALVSTILDR